MERIVAIACDHGGLALKEVLKVALPDVKWLDLGTNSADSVDYPDFADKLADAIKAAAGDSSKPITLLAIADAYFKTVNVNYHGGLQNPHLQRDDAKPDYLDELIKPATGK